VSGRDKEWEPVGEDEEVVEDEYEAIGEDEEAVEKDEEVVEGDERVVAGVGVADPVYAYILGAVEAPPKSLGEWRFYDLFVELWRAERLGHAGRAKRVKRLIWMFCPFKPRGCPLYTFVSRCPFGMEKSCRAFAFAKRGQRGRGWYKK
jgi:hypothetical protein